MPGGLVSSQVRIGAEDLAGAAGDIACRPGRCARLPLPPGMEQRRRRR